MVGGMLLQMAHTKEGPQSRLKLGGLYQLVAKHPHPTVSHWGDGHGDTSCIQNSWVSPSQVWLGRCLGSCKDLVSPQNLLGGSDEAKLGSSHPRVSLQKALATSWLSLLSLHAQGGPPWTTSSCNTLLQERDIPGDREDSPRVLLAP